MARSKSALPADIEAVRKRFEAWRARRERGARIPRELWDEAERLAAKHGVFKTARSLGLDYMAVKRRITIAVPSDRAPAKSPVVRGQSRFVEVTPPCGPTGHGCVIELEDESGAKVRIRLPRGDAAELGAFARAFLRGER